MNQPADQPGALFIREVRNTLSFQSRRILHCLSQLDDEDLLWRPDPSHNSVQTLILHLCGSTRQWICAGIGAAPDHRNRPGEFARQEPIDRTELARMFQGMLADADAVLAQLPPDRLAERCRIQGFDLTVMGALLDTTTHFVGHTYQIVYITRTRRGDSYRFFWTPQSLEQISAQA